MIQPRIKRKEAHSNQRSGSELKADFSIAKIFPWFILVFLAVALVVIVALAVEIAMEIV